MERRSHSDAFPLSLTHSVPDKHRSSSILPDLPGCRGQALLMATPGPAPPVCRGRNVYYRSYQTLTMVAWYHWREVPT